MRTFTLPLIIGLMTSTLALAAGGDISRTASTEAASSRYGRSTEAAAATAAVQEAVVAHDEAVAAARNILREVPVIFHDDPGPGDPVPEAVPGRGLESEGPDGDPDLGIPDEDTQVPVDLGLELEINRLVLLKELLEQYGGGEGRLDDRAFGDLMADIDRLLDMMADIENSAGMGFSPWDMVELLDLLNSGPMDVVTGIFEEFVILMWEVDQGSDYLLWQQEERDGKDYNGDGIVGEPDPDTTSDGDDDDACDAGDDDDAAGDDDVTDCDIWSSGEPDPDGDDDGDGIPNKSDSPDWGDGFSFSEYEKDSPKVADLIDAMDTAYDPVTFAEVIQTSLETSGLEGVSTLVDNQLEVLEQMNAR
jgi:hypothetical protein